MTTREAQRKALQRQGYAHWQILVHPQTLTAAMLAEGLITDAQLDDAADFADAWKRYLPPASDSRHKGNSRHNFDNQNNFVADVAEVAEGMAKGDADPFAGLKDASLKLAADPWADLAIPADFDRRQRGAA